MSKNGQRFVAFERPVAEQSVSAVVAEENNWLVFGPFDLATAKGADLNFYMQLGDVEAGQRASLLALVSVDGSTFHGTSFAGATCGWYYRNLDLRKVPDLGDVTGEGSVWFAFVPGSLTAAPEAAIGLDYLRLLLFHPELPPEHPIPVVKSLAPSASYQELVEYYSPVISQDVGCTVYGDYISRIDYDGDYVGNNNWDNLGYPVKARPLPAHVYSSVVETPTHYFIFYALFHPADDFHCHTASHENDLEGMVMCVVKDGSTYGDLRLVQLQAHLDFYQYIPPGETGIYDREDDVDGTLLFSGVYPGVHPIVFVQGGGHGIEARDPGDWPSVHYYFTGNAEDPDVVGFDHAGYDILSTFAEMWEQRTNCCGGGHLFDSWGNYQRWGFDIVGLGTQFDGDSGTQTADQADPPWNWDDDDDGGDWQEGDWFMHPAAYHYFRFYWDEEFSAAYTFHPFGFDHLGGDVYNGANGTTTLSHGPYVVVQDMTVLPGQVLAIDPAVTVEFRQGAQVNSAGVTQADGSSGTVRMVTEDRPDAGMEIDGEMIMHNGGEIRFP